MPETSCDIGPTSDFPDGQMREVEAQGQKILIIHRNNHWYAIGGQCPHYSVSLASGVLCGDRVVCPWHKSVFRITDGALLEPPALDSLSRYPVSVDGDRVLVQLPGIKTPLSPAGSAQEADHRTFVLAGAGGAGTAAAEQLRHLGFQGRIVLLSGEQELPYDRTKLSKEFLSGNAAAEELALRPPEFWKDQGIERQPQDVSEVNTHEHKVMLSDGSPLAYDCLLLATGSIPRKLEVPGHDLGGIFTLRSQADAQKMAEAAQPGVRTVVIGGSFIAMEAASCFALRRLPVTVVIAESAPFVKQLGPEVGSILQQWHESHGVVFRLQAEAERFEGTGVVRHVVLKSGEKLPADLVVIGVGVRPATDFRSDLSKRKDGGIIVNSYLQAAEDTYAAGDMAVFPESYSGQPARIEHWRVAEQQGRLAAGNMLGQEQSFEGVPYFWTNHFGTRFDYIGHAAEWDELILQRGEEFPAFLAFYIRQGRVMAASACRYDQEIAAVHELLRGRSLPSLEEIRKGVDWVSLAQRLNDNQRIASV